MDVVVEHSWGLGAEVSPVQTPKYIFLLTPHTPQWGLQLLIILSPQKNLTTSTRSTSVLCPLLVTVS